MEGTRIKETEGKGSDAKYKPQKGLFMLCCVLYSIVIAFPIMDWRIRTSTDIQQVDLKNVSIFLLKAPFLDKRSIKDYIADSSIKHEGQSPEHPYMVANVQNIVNGKENIMEYACDMNSTFMPLECLNNTHLLFMFAYQQSIDDFGGIEYNFATMQQNVTEVGRVTCVPSQEHLRDGWKLFYFTPERVQHHGYTHIRLNTPWPTSCTTPEPWYQPSVNVCS
jgi:hypothetical protein